MLTALDKIELLSLGSNESIQLFSISKSIRIGLIQLRNCPLLKAGSSCTLTAFSCLPFLIPINQPSCLYCDIILSILNSICSGFQTFNVNVTGLCLNKGCLCSFWQLLRAYLRMNNVIFAFSTVYCPPVIIALLDTLPCY